MTIESPIPVIVNGAGGKMGREVIKHVSLSVRLCPSLSVSRCVFARMRFRRSPTFHFATSTNKFH